MDTQWNGFAGKKPSDPNKRDDYNPITNVGKSDLDPLNRGGFGMLFPPPGYPGFENVRPIPPPGARYDPKFSDTSDICIPSRRKPDHMRPPPD